MKQSATKSTKSTKDVQLVSLPRRRQKLRLKAKGRSLLDMFLGSVGARPVPMSCKAQTNSCHMILILCEWRKPNGPRQGRVLIFTLQSSASRVEPGASQRTPIEMQHMFALGRTW